MKKKSRSNFDDKYNKLFKFLTFDQSLFSSIFITVAIILYAIVILVFFIFVLKIPIEQVKQTTNSIN
ncbi:MAG: hypothetical protein mread185_000497 [Mycoplasmataceae bacterium]|nr:MAG: hypothetical protein mread185_000497 [Mycoplasmataceae bacterium]